MLMMRERVMNSKMIVQDVADFKEPPFKSAHNLMRNYGQTVNSNGQTSVNAGRVWRTTAIIATPIPIGR